MLAAESPHVDVEPHVFGEFHGLIVSADRLEIVPAAKHDTGIDARSCDNRDEHRVTQRDANGPSLRPDSRRTADHVGTIHMAGDNIESVGVNLGIGVDEAEYSSPGRSRAGISRGANTCLLYTSPSP